MHPLADPARTHRRGRLNDLHPQILTIARERALASADHWSVAELTDDDVREMKQFLTDTCTDVKRWLPEPEWCPGWQSEAAGRGNDERGPDGLWGPDVVRSVYVAAAMFVEAVLQCMRAMAASIAIDTTP